MMLTIAAAVLILLVVLAAVHGGSDGPDPYDGEGW